MNMIAILSKSILFQNIPESDISGLLETTAYRVVAYRPKDIIALQGTPCNYLMIVLNGLLQGQMVNDAGKLVVIEELEAAQLLAPAFLYAPKNNLPVNIIAMEPSEILFIHRDDFTVIHLTDTQQEIADSFGVTRPSLARALAEMEQEGIISIDRKVITICNIQLLRQMGQ